MSWLHFEQSALWYANDSHDILDEHIAFDCLEFIGEIERCDTFLSILESYVTMVETVLSMDKKVLVVVWCSAGVHRSVTFSCLLANVWLLCQLQSLKSSLFIMVPWGLANLRWFDIIWAQGWLGLPTLPAVCGHSGVSLTGQNFLLTCNVQITDCHLIAEMWGFSMRHFKPV